jgi:uncharacterized protein (DUF1501 family)
MPRRKLTNPATLDFLSRRRLLEIGAVALPWLNFSRLCEAAATRPAAGGAAPAAKIKSCIVLFYFGGPSHLDTWDPKPDAPAEIRGEFQPISTRVPGVQFGEHLPRCARVADKLAIVRSMHHTMRNHNSAAAVALTGRTPAKGDQELLADGPNSFPCYGAALSKVSPVVGELPPHVALPHVMYNVVELPGQNSGFLGPSYNPFQVTRDPSAAGFRVDELLLPDDLTPARLDARQSLLAGIDARSLEANQTAGGNSMSVYREKAFALLRSDAVRRAFDISQEAPAIRDRYGRHKLGQSLLLARRLVEAGVRFINVNDKIRNSQLTNWDSHQNNAARLKDDLLPPADEAFAALIEDLSERGLLDSTLVVALGEFGRTPLVNKLGGRDHWPDCFSAVLAGGGISGGTVYGSSDRIGAHPSTHPVTPGDLAATIFRRFGLDLGLELHDMLGRPQKLALGQPLDGLF